MAHLAYGIPVNPDATTCCRALSEKRKRNPEECLSGIVDSAHKVKNRFAGGGGIECEGKGSEAVKQEA